MKSDAASQRVVVAILEPQSHFQGSGRHRSRSDLGLRSTLCDDGADDDTGLGHGASRRERERPLCLATPVLLVKKPDAVSPTEKAVSETLRETARSEQKEIAPEDSQERFLV